VRTAIEIDRAGKPERIFHRRDPFAWVHAPGLECAECGSGPSTSRTLEPETFKRRLRGRSSPQGASRARRTPSRVSYVGVP
jgi:hypothetical protein